MLLKQFKVPFLSLFTGILTIHAFLGIHNLKSMDVVRSPLKDTVLFNPHIRPMILKTLQAAEKADLAEVAVDAFILSDTAIIDLLIKIHAKNPQKVTVHVHESNANNKKTIQILESNGITVSKSKQHAKRIIIAYKDHQEELWHRRILTGSYNASDRAQRNQEMMVLEKNDSPAHAAHRESHVGGAKRIRKLNLDGDTSDQKVVEQTPTKKTIIDNSTHDLHASIAPRIENTVAGDTLYFASMNYGDKILHKALLNAAKRGVLIHLLLDTDATTEDNIKKLDKLNQNGANIVFPTAKIQTKENQAVLGKNGIFHKKYLVRVRGTNILTYVSTANATAHAQEDFNVSTFYPNQDEMAQDIIAAHQKLAQTGITYQVYKASGAILPKRKSPNKRMALFQEDE